MAEPSATRGVSSEEIIDFLNYHVVENITFESEMMGSLYGYFKSQVEKLLGEGEDVSKIALVSNVTMGITRGLKESSSDSVNLVSCLAYKLITDKYGGFLNQKGGLAKLVLETPID